MFIMRECSSRRNSCPPSDPRLLLVSAGTMNLPPPADPLKLDLNTLGPFSSNFIGESWEWPLANDTRRAEIYEAHKRYDQGLLYFLATSPTVPSAMRKEMSEFGLCADEFEDSDYWPTQLYVRESVRMVNEYVLREGKSGGVLSVVEGLAPGNSSIGIGNWGIDVHQVQRVAIRDPRDHSLWRTVDEGDLEVHAGNFEIPYGSIVPRKSEVTNLLVPTCIASSHLAYGAYRLESPYMVVGHSAGAAAALALEGGRQIAVQDVSITKLQALLRKQGQVLTLQEQIPAPEPPGGGGAPSADPPVVVGSCDSAAASALVETNSAGSGALLLSGTPPLCVSVIGYSTANGAAVVGAKCHASDRTPHHQNQEWLVDAPSVCLQSQAVSGKCVHACLVREAKSKVTLGSCGTEAAYWAVNATAHRVEAGKGGGCLSSLKSDDLASVPARMDGFNFLYGHWGSGDAVPADAYNSTHAVDELSAIKKQTDANYIALSYLLYQKNVDTAGPIYRRPDTPSDVALTAAIDAAHKLGIKAMIRPLVNADPKLADPEAPHTWRGMIGRNFTSAQWNSWFASYETMIYAAAEMASKAKADSLCVGGELIVASHQEAHWRSIIKGVRARFSGPIMYAANHGNEHEVAFWDAVDWIGVDACKCSNCSLALWFAFSLIERRWADYALAPSVASPTLSQLVAAWQPIRDGLKALSHKQNKPLMFAEVGYCSTAESNQHPAQCGGALSEQAQANLYEALLQVFYAKEEASWFCGIFWWDWSATPSDSGPSNGGFSPNGKLAAKVAQKYYSNRSASAEKTGSLALKSDDRQCSNASLPLDCQTLPTGNACPGACETGTAFTVQGTTSQDDKREFLVSLGLTSNKGVHSRPTPYHDKVTLYSGIVGEPGTGDIWSFNPLLTQRPGSGSYNAQVIELDLNNQNAHRGDADGGAGLAPPVTYGLSLTGAGGFRSTAAIGVMGQKSQWNRGIVFAADSVNQSAFQDLMHGHQKSIDIRGSPIYGVYQASPRTKNLFRGNTSHEGELRLRGPVVVERDDKKERSVVLSAGGTEEVASSGVAKLSDGGTATVSVSHELCSQHHEHSYQLTAMGRPMRDLHVASELSPLPAGGCSFAIGGGESSGEKPGKVSWRIHSRAVDKRSGSLKSDDVAAGTAKRPNVLFVVFDDLRPELLSGGYNRTWVAAPNLASVAARGTTFLRAYTQAPQCCP